MFLDIDKRNPNAEAAIDDTGQSISYGELIFFSNEFKSFISERSLIFILSENSIGSFAGYIASLYEKIVPLLLNSSIDEFLLQNLIELYHPQYLWLPDNLIDKFPESVIFSKYGFSLVKTMYLPFKMHEDLALLLPTSGSTGSSKLVRHSYKNIEANALNVSELFEITENDRALATLPIYYTMGLSVITSHFISGSLILLTKRNLMDREYWNFVKEQKATIFTGIPYSFELLYKLRFFRMNLPDLRIITQGGGKMSEQLFFEYASFAQKTGKKFIATYGQTEGTARMAFLPAELATQKICSIGKAIPNGELFLVNTEGEKIEEFEAEGQLVFKGENVTMGYAFNCEDLIKGDENNGILFTGDIARRDSDGFYYIIGRQSRFLKLFGMRVSLDECESLIKSFFKIECACIGDDSCMYVFINNQDFSNQVLNLLTEKTRIIASAFKIIVLSEIPKNETGKILYSKLEMN